MEKVKLSSLEALVRLPGSPQAVDDLCVLTCGCLVSEAEFRHTNLCRLGHPNTSFLSAIEPLRELYQIIAQALIQNRRRRSSSKKSFAAGDGPNLLELFYKFAREDVQSTETSSSSVMPRTIEREEPNETLLSLSYSPETFFSGTTENIQESNSVNHFNETKEYNFSKCFPFYRKQTSYNTLNSKMFSSLSFALGSMLKKSYKYIGSDLHTYVRSDLAMEVTRFVLITDKKWELYEYSVPIDSIESNPRPTLICCGKLTGEYGPNQSKMTNVGNSDEIVLTSDSRSNSMVVQESNQDVRKNISNWTLVYCKLSTNFLVLAGTRGLIRVININADMNMPIGQVVYTYSSQFPIRCVAIARDSPIVACGVTAKEKSTGREQPFIILQRMSVNNGAVVAVEPITVTMPHRDPVKFIKFNRASTHLLTCTSKEGRYSVIRLTNKGAHDNYKRPRLIWTDVDYFKNSKRYRPESNDYAETDENELEDMMMINEGITDLLFGVGNSIVIASCSLKNRPPEVVMLHGENLDSAPRSSSISENFSVHSDVSEDSDLYGILSSEMIMKIPEVGTFIHKIAISPRNDAQLHLSKDGSIYLVAATNHTMTTQMSQSKRVVLLGEVAGAPSSQESASILFSPDGGKVFAIDRRGIFSVFDFTKGKPGVDSDVLKCKIIAA